jgi:uncharacterized protein YsxB (DUF464 family)
MIVVDAGLDSQGVLCSCRVSGHSGFGTKGNDVICAAVSVLVRSLVRTISFCTDVSCESKAPKRGVFEFFAEYSDEGKGFLYCAGLFFLEGIRSLTEEHPDFCTLNIHSSC